MWNKLLFSLFLLLLSVGVVTADNEAISADCVIGTTHATLPVALNDMACSQINIPSGTYTGSHTAFSGFARTLTITGVGATEPILQPNNAVSHILWVQASSYNITLENLAFHSGGNSALKVLAGATVTVDDVEFRSNLTTTSGGAILNALDATLVVKNSYFVNNTAATAGGAIYNLGTLTLSDSLIEGNVADNAAIYSSGSMTITTSTFLHNGGSPGLSILNDNGGAIYNDGVATITASTFEENFATFGGAIYNRQTLTLSNNRIASNGAGDKGGGIFIDTPLENKSITIEQSTIISNTAGTDGAGVYQTTDSMPLTIINTTLSNNIATGNGGGIWSGDQALIKFSTVVENEATGGGGAAFGSGLYVADSNFRTGPTRILASIFANNISNNCRTVTCRIPDVVGIDCYLEAVTGNNLNSFLGNNVVEDAGSNCATTLLGNDLQVDPQLASMQTIGRHTYYLPLGSSPIIDRVSAVLCPDKDQVGALRPFNFLSNGTPCDTGAIEFGATPTAVALGGISAETTPAITHPLLVLMLALIVLWSAQLIYKKRY